MASPTKGRNKRSGAAKKPKASNSGGSNAPSTSKGATKKASAAANALSRLPTVPGPPHTLSYLKDALYVQVLKSSHITPVMRDNPKDALLVYTKKHTGKLPEYSTQQCLIEGQGKEVHYRATYEDADNNLQAYGDGKNTQQASKAAAFDAVMRLVEIGVWDKKPPSTNLLATASQSVASQQSSGRKATLSNGAEIAVERAREFMQFYCREYRFGNPVIDITSDKVKNKHGGSGQRWIAQMRVGGTEVGTGQATNKKDATAKCYLDTVVYIESCDPELYSRFESSHQPGEPVGTANPVIFKLTEDLDDEIQSVCHSATQSLLFSKRPRPAGQLLPGEKAPEAKAVVEAMSAQHHDVKLPSADRLRSKSAELLKRLNEYHSSSRCAEMREARNRLPVAQNVSDILVQIALNQVVICMAATGSGKSTQVPQLLLDDAILEEKGAETNVICTQPRRIAAISLAQRVADERCESLGQSVGYQVRFESKLPQPNGSITYCTTGILLRRLQNALGQAGTKTTWLDTISHLVLDEVHERDVQTDLLLVVLKKIMAERRAAGKPDIKIVLMSATVDPKLFQQYFPDEVGRLAPVVEIPGRAFPVEKHFMETTIPRLRSLRLPSNAGGWVWEQKNVQEYLHRELDLRGGMHNDGSGADVVDDLEIPYPLVSLYIAEAMAGGNDGHVLVFLPGWDDIKIINQHLTESSRYPLFDLDFNDRSKYEIHILHSAVPVADQQAVFSPPPPGVRRVILSTNIAETSVTIPDVTTVVDTGRVKEMRYDPSRHLSSLVSAWVGTSNLNQRAGRAGRHRAGEYFGVLSKARYDQLAPNSTVEMQRTDLTDVVLHIKALNLPGMDPEDVLAAAIEPPNPERVTAAMQQLLTIGALDANRDLTSLGLVLLQLPVDAALGKMCLYGLFFRCVEPAVTLAAILSTRDPFLAPIEAKAQAAAVKESWSPSDYRSDALAILRAYKAWTDTQARDGMSAANRFAFDNFLSKPVLFQIKQNVTHIVQSMSSVIEVILGHSSRSNDGNNGARWRPRSRYTESTPELNIHSESKPLIAALIAMASPPKFAVRRNEKVFATPQDRRCFIHPSSVNHAKHTKGKEDETQPGEKEIYAFLEKTQNVSQLGSSNSDPMTMLKMVTRLDPLTFMLFGANQIQHARSGVICDDWLPVKGHFQALDDVERLKLIMDASMLRVLEGIGNRRKPQHRQERAGAGAGGDRSSGAPRENQDWDDQVDRNEDAPDNEDDGQAFGDRTDLALAPREVDEFEQLTKGIVSILGHYSADRLASLDVSRSSTRPGSPNAAFGGGGQSAGPNGSKPYSTSAHAHGRGPPSGPSGYGGYRSKQRDTAGWGGKGGTNSNTGSGGGSGGGGNSTHFEPPRLASSSAWD